MQSYTILWETSPGRSQRPCGMITSSPMVTVFLGILRLSRRLHGHDDLFKASDCHLNVEKKMSFEIKKTKTWVRWDVSNKITNILSLINFAKLGGFIVYIRVTMWCYHSLARKQHIGGIRSLKPAMLVVWPLKYGCCFWTWWERWTPLQALFEMVIIWRMRDSSNGKTAKYNTVAPHEDPGTYYRIVTK